MTIIQISGVVCCVLVAFLKILEFIGSRLQKAGYSGGADLTEPKDRARSHLHLLYALRYQMVETEGKGGKLQFHVIVDIVVVVVTVIAFSANLSSLRVSASSRYEAAVTEMDKGNYAEAIRSFEELGDYRDSLARIQESENWIKYQHAQELMDEAQFEAAAEMFQELDGFEDSGDLYREALYRHAIELYERYEYESATLIFQTLGDYEKSDLYVAQIALALYKDRQHTVYEEACKLYGDKAYELALPEFKKLGDYLDSEALAQDCEDRLKRQEMAQTASAGIRYAIGVKADGTVVATDYNDEGQTNVSGWEDIVSVAAKGAVSLGLRSDGTVVSSHRLGNVDVADWEDVIAISVGERFAIGLRNDGTLYSQGHPGDGQLDVGDWTGIVAIATGWRHTVGLDSNGKVWITGYGAASQLRQIQHDRDQWTDIKAIAAGGGGNGTPGSGHTVGLRADGTVVAVGDNSYGQCDVSGEEWKNIVAIAAGDWHTVGLRADGTVVSTRPDAVGLYLGACDVDDWNDIVAVSAGCGTTIGITSDGSVKAIGFNDYHQSDLANRWTNIMVYSAVRQ